MIPLTCGFGRVLPSSTALLVTSKVATSGRKLYGSGGWGATGPPRSGTCGSSRCLPRPRPTMHGRRAQPQPHPPPQHPPPPEGAPPPRGGGAPIGPPPPRPKGDGGVTGRVAVRALPPSETVE